MASIAHSREVLKRQWLCRSEFLTQYLRPDQVIAAAQASPYSWRQRIWPPMLTLWAFLVQVLHPGWSCRAAVAHVLAEHAATGKTLDASADPSTYCQARQRVPLSVYSQALRTVGETLQSQVSDTHLWEERDGVRYFFRYASSALRLLSFRISVSLVISVV